MLTARSLLPTPLDTILEQPRVLSAERTDDNLLICSDDDGHEIIIFLKRVYPSFVRSWVYMKLSDSIYKNDESKWMDNNCWSTNEIVVELIEPMRIWRLCFSGLLRSEAVTKPVGDDIDNSVSNYVKFYFLFHPNSCPVYFNKTDAFMFAPSTTELSENSVIDLFNGYEQWGMLHGEIIFDTNKFELNMKCLRKRDWSQNMSLRNLIIFGNHDLLISAKIKAERRIYGKGHVRTLQKHNLVVVRNCIPINQECLVPSEFIIRDTDSNCNYVFTDGNNEYEIFNFGIICSYFTANLNNEQVKGFSILLKNDNNLMIDKIDLRSRFLTKAINVDPKIKVVDLTEEFCLPVELVGGKAASLSQLCSIKNRSQIFSEDCNLIYEVPNGFCITVNAMDDAVSANLDLKEILNILEISLSKLLKDDEDLFQKLEDAWKSVSIAEILRFEIAARLKCEKLYAVRSSGIFEDILDVSCAGQNSTYLNVCGSLDDILKAVKLCWASLYTILSVQYRRENGLPLVTKMGVIIQEMVQPDIAGVLFTRDPYLGDPRHTVISYCAGLAEKVVSGMHEIHTVHYDKINRKILDKQVASDTENDENCPNITETECTELFQISAELEKIFDYPLDIEWAILNGTIYLLQCRPITTIFNWNDFEVTHELDAAFSSKFDAITFHNSGEVLSGLSSPLSFTLTNLAIEEAFLFGNKHPGLIYHKKLINMIQYRVAINLFSSLITDVQAQIPMYQKIIDFTICGQVITTENLYNIARLRNGTPTKFSAIRKLFLVLKLFISSNRVISKAKSIETSFRINFDTFTRSKELLQHIHSQFTILKQIFECHLNETAIGNFLKTATLCVITGNKEEKLAEALSQMSLALSHCGDIVSAEVPHSLQKMAQIILKNEKYEEFLNLNCSNGLDWLKQNSEDGYNEFFQFLKKHGCRGIKEIDLMAETWDMNPEIVINMLQTIIRASSFTISKSESPELAYSFDNRNSAKRWLVNRLLSQCQKAVVNRELTKRCLVNIIHQFRLAFNKLSQLLHEENLIPDRGLIYYLTNYELHQLVIDNSSNRSRILHKGIRRRRLWKQLECLRYDDIIIGLPKSKEIDYYESENSLIQCKGFAVSNNSAQGRCCILENVTEGNNLIAGDILVTRSIDIGWSPYFPILSGIVTELGGIVSHGAVVAREYGLPCLISVKNATSIFRTGDLIRICGTEGTVKKIYESI